MRRPEIIETLQQIRFKTWRIEILANFEPDDPCIRFCWVAHVACSKTGQPITLTSSAVRVDEHSTEVMVVKMARDVLRNLVLHETDEHFRYKGIMVFDPHIGEEGYVPERVATPRTIALSPVGGYSEFKGPNSSDPVRVEYDGRLYGIDSEEYTRFR